MEPTRIGPKKTSLQELELLALDSCREMLHRYDKFSVVACIGFEETEEGYRVIAESMRYPRSGSEMDLEGLLEQLLLLVKHRKGNGIPSTVVPFPSSD